MRFLPVSILQRYVFVDLTRTFLLALGVVLGLFVFFISVEAGRIPGMGVSSMLIFAPHAVPFIMKYALPVSLLLAVTFTFNRLGADNEIIALRAAGSTLWPFAGPVFLFALCLSLLLLPLTMIWLPHAHVAKRKIFREATLNLLENLPAGRQQFEFGRVRISYGDARNRRVSDIYITEQKELAVSLRILAKEGVFAFDRESKILHIALQDSEWTWFQHGGRNVNKTFVDVVPYRVHLGQLSRPRIRQPKDCTLSQIQGIQTLLRDLPENFPIRWRRPHLVFEVHKRYAESFAPLIMILIGMPLGVLARKRGKLAAFFTAFIPVILAYYPLTFIGEGLATKGNFYPVPAAWAADAVLGGIGVLLTWRMLFR
ncbi:MAG: LptF/LptG family permease [Planctomycetota bacterium]|jgi:lipopolysaccharide export system permease protein